MEAEKALEGREVTEANAAEEVDTTAPPEGADELKALDAAVLQPFRDGFLQADDQLVQGVVQVIADGLDRLRTVSEEVGLGGPAPSDWTARAEAALELRRAVRSSLVVPLRQAFEGGGPWSVIHRHLDEALAEADRLSAELPETIEGTWPRDALGRQPSDTFRRRIAKGLGFLSVARKGGEARDLPARALARQHLADSTVGAADVGAEALGRAWSNWSASLESAFVRWSDVALRAMARVERPEQEDAEEHWKAVAAACAQLVGDLDTCLSEKPTLEAPLAQLRESRWELNADAAVAGSFVYNPTDKELPPLKRTERINRALEEWDAGVAARLELLDGLLSLFVGLSGAQQRLASRLREGLLSNVDALTDAADKLAGERPDEDATLTEAEHMQLAERVRALLEPALAAVPDQAETDELVQGGANATVEAVQAMVRQTPSDVRVHAADARLAAGARPVETRTIAVQELTRQSFDALRVDRIRTASLGLSNAVATVRTNIDEFSNVFTFAHEAALKELEEDGEDAHARATGLVREAVDSIRDGLRAEAKQLHKVYLGALSALADEVGGGANALVDRMGAGQVAARLLAARSLFSEVRAWLNERWGPYIDRAWQALTARFRLVRMWLSRGVKVGGTIVGGQGQQGAESVRSVKEVADTSTLTDKLPLVYQRLFSFEPLADESLLRGRTSELAEGMAQWRQWEYEEGVPLIVTGRAGTGVTSFINVLGAGVEDDEVGRVLRISLSERITDEASLARMLSEQLGAEMCDTLDALADVIFASEEGAIPNAVSVDNLEHIYLRVPNGTDLIERLLTLMAETEPKIFWIGGVTQSAWQLIVTAEPTAVSQVDVLDLDPLTPAQLREAVMARHRRSGLAVHFHEPDTRRHRVRRWFLRLRDEEAADQMAEKDFFDTLHRTSAGHLRLALYQWLSTADFEAGEGVFMPPPSRPNFSVLDSLTLTQNFTLKAFLEHCTLTLSEHDRIFRLPRHESYQIFESLGNRHLIEIQPAGPAAAPEEGEERSEIAEELRYRVTPLMAGAVVNHLRARNIVH